VIVGVIRRKPVLTHASIVCEGMLASVNSVNSVTWLPFLISTLPAEGFPWDDLYKIFSGCQRMAKVPNAVEILPKISTALVGRTSVTDDRRTCDRK